MFKTHSRAGVQVESLAPKGSPVDQDAALADKIEQAGSLIDEWAEQTFAAALDTQSGYVNVGRNGYAEVFPRFKPVVGLSAFSIGALPDQMSAVSSFTGAMVMENSFTIPVVPLAAMTSSEGPIQFGGIGVPWDRAYAQWSYVFGFPVTYLTAAIADGATSISVADTTGIVANQTWLNVRSGRYRYRSLVTSVSTADAGGLGFGPGTVGLATAAPALTPNPDISIQVDGMPSSLYLANVLLIRALIKGKTPTTSARGKDRKGDGGDDYREAWDIIRKLAQVVGE
jgi:hypothetical protein